MTIEAEASMSSSKIVGVGVLPVAELEALRRDAARYRWLREQDRITVDQSPLKAAYRFARWVPPEQVDAAIDAALAASVKGAGHE